MSATISFDDDDLEDHLPSPGFYRGRITAARFRRSSQGNRMVQVTYTLEGVAPGHDRLSEYFVTEGASAYAVTMARRRLVGLFRACNLEPKRGEEMALESLVEAELEVKVEHDEWEGRTRLRVVDHRRLGSVPEDEPPF
jgi:hypothetical protein